MKAEHRHELKTNELAQWLSNFPQWYKENQRVIIYLAVVTVLVVAAYIWKKYQTNIVALNKKLHFTNLVNQVALGKFRILQSSTQGIDSSYILLQPADALKKLSKETKNNTAAAIALLESAKALRMELHYRIGSVDKADFDKQINQAKDTYTLVLDKAGSDTSLKSQAKFGIALCEEDLGNFEQAKQLYVDLAENDEYKNTIAASQAKFRLSSMDEYKKEVIFKPGPKPAIETEEFSEEIEIPALELPSSNSNASVNLPELNLPSN